MPFKPKKSALLISSLYLLSPLTLTQAAEPAAPAPGKTETARKAEVELPTVVVKGKRNTDAAAKKKVYEENITSTYIDREDLTRTQITSPADVLKGMNGVYSMDPRNGSSITPNVRGLSGEGRVPLTVDGTEQSTNVFLQVYGVGNRNYVDPAMFRSVEVEKGPSLSRGIKSGVGGAINVRTIEAGDIIPEGKNFGIEVNAEISGNSTKPQVDASSYFGRDYRSIPGAGLGSNYNVMVDQPVPNTKGKSSLLNLNDHSEMISIAGRNEVTDILFAYSQRDKGNYFAGKQGAERYTNNDAYAENSTAQYFPNLTKLYFPGNEVLSTASHTETTLLKNNWYLPNAHKIGLSVMRTDMDYGETNAGQSILSLGFAEALARNKNPIGQLVAEWPRSKLRLDTYKLSHEWKPEGSPWINLQANLWQTKANGVRHQTGNSPYFINKSAAMESYTKLIGDWRTCRTGSIADILTNNLPSGRPGQDCYFSPDLSLSMGATEPVEPDHDGTIIAGSAQWTRHERTGFDFSNQMRLASNLRLTVGGGLQREKLDERVSNMEISGWFFPGGQAFHYAAANYGPRSGERREATGTFNFEWEPTPWLSLSAGARYNRYSANDTGLAERRRQQIATAQATRLKTGVQLKYATLMTEAEWAKYKELANAMEDARSKINYDDPSVYKTWDVYADASGAKIPVRITLPTEDPAFKAAYQALADYAGQHNANPFPNIGQGYYGGWGGAGVEHGDGYRAFYTKATENGTDPDPYSSDKTAPYWQTTLVLPVVNGKVDSSKSPFANGELSLDQTASYTEGGQTGTFHKVIQASGTNNKGETLYTNITEADSWRAPDTQSGHAWSPVLSATLRPTLYGTVFLRHAQTTRFPSLFELASTSTNLEGVGMLGVSGASKPERSTNWEIGYAHDLTQFFPDLRMADARLSYFDTEIKDFIERDSHLAVIQYDKKKTSGIEFQSRFDSGRFFGSLGATYRRKQELCDKDYAYQFDMYRNRMPECMTGGFPDTLTATSLQPRYSVNLELGTRLLNEQLELGLRSTYHAKAQNKQMDDLLSKPYFKEIWVQDTMSQLYWHSVVLHDVYSRWRVRKDLDLSLKISNLTDRYYMDPMSKIAAPGPGRTLTVGMRARF